MLHQHTSKTSTTRFEMGLSMWELVTYKGGKVEVYRGYADQPELMQFLGYYEDLCATEIGALIHSKVVKHVEEHRNYWRKFLPGAVSWVSP